MWAPAGVVWHLYGVGAAEPKEKSTPHWLGAPTEPAAPWKRPSTVGAGITRLQRTVGAARRDVKRDAAKRDAAPTRSLFTSQPLSRLPAEARRQRILARGPTATRIQAGLQAGIQAEPGLGAS